MLVQICLSYPKLNIPVYDIFDNRINIIVQRRARRNGHDQKYSIQRRGRQNMKMYLQCLWRHVLGYSKESGDATVLRLSVSSLRNDITSIR